MSYIIVAFQILGSLAFFIFGMKFMSDGIQKAAGDGLRQVMRVMTHNRYMGVLTGFIITSIVQSSSATTVMTVSFVNAGVLSLVESGGIMMGANIGTTTTAWIISSLGFKMKLASLCIPLLAFAVPMYLSKKESVKNWAQFLIGFAFLFIGLDELKSSVPDLKSSPYIIDFLSKYSSPALYVRLLYVMVGALVTIIVQSSSAAMALTLVLVGQGLPLEVAASMVLGENIGTTITAELASLVGNVHAKRSAKVHTLFNLIGVTWMVILLPYFTGWIENFIPADISEGVQAEDAETRVNSFRLSMFHTVFNALNVLLLIGFLPAIIKLATKWVKKKEGEEDSFTLESLGPGILATPELSILEATREVYKLGEKTIQLIKSTTNIVKEVDKNKFSIEKDKIFKTEQLTDNIEREILDFLAELSKDNLSEASNRKVKTLIHVSDDLESVADYCAELVSNLDKRRKLKAYFSPEYRENLKQMEVMLDEASIQAIKNLENYSKDQSIDRESAVEIESRINATYKQMTSQMIKEISKSKDMAVSMLFYRDILNTYERIADKLMGITEAISENN